jgi:hypothetical protein
VTNPVALPPGPRKARDETGTDWIGNNREYDGDRAALPLQCGGYRNGKDHVGLQVDQLFREGPHPIDLANGPAIIDPYIASIRPSQFLKAVDECCDKAG